MRGFRERFKVEGLAYSLNVSDTGQIAFWLEGGSTRRGKVRKQELFEDFPVLNDVDLLTVHPMAIFGQVSRRVEAWVGSEKPLQFYFRTEDLRRQRIYRWLARRAARRLSEYWFYELEGVFYFFRRSDARPAPSNEAERSETQPLAIRRLAGRRLSSMWADAAAI